MNVIPKQVKSFFYVDDDTDDLEFFEEAVGQIGKSVRLFTNPEDVLAAVAQHADPLLLFLDLNMPHKNGFEVLKEIKESNSAQKFPVIIYSTASDSATVDRCRNLGASLYIRKPTSLAALQQVLRKVLLIDWETFKPDVKNFMI